MAEFKKKRQANNYKESYSLQNRWHLCQKIGKQFYETEATYEALLYFMEHFEDYDFKMK